MHTRKRPLRRFAGFAGLAVLGWLVASNDLALGSMSEEANELDATSAVQAYRCVAASGCSVDSEEIACIDASTDFNADWCASLSTLCPESDVRWEAGSCREQSLETSVVLPSLTPVSSKASEGSAGATTENASAAESVVAESEVQPSTNAGGEVIEPLVIAEAPKLPPADDGQESTVNLDTAETSTQIAGREPLALADVYEVAAAAPMPTCRRLMFDGANVKWKSLKNLILESTTETIGRDFRSYECTVSYRVEHLMEPECPSGFRVVLDANRDQVCGNGTPHNDQNCTTKYVSNLPCAPEYRQGAETCTPSDADFYSKAKTPKGAVVTGVQIREGFILNARCEPIQGA